MKKIKHAFLPQIFVPTLAIEDNIEFLFNDEDYDDIITSDDVVCKVVKLEYVNPLSERGKEIIKDIYKRNIEFFLVNWYERVNFQGLNFCFITLEKKEI